MIGTSTRRTIVSLLVCWLCLTQLAGQIHSFPYVEDFEQFSRCVPDCFVSCGLINHWENDRADNFDWIVNSGPTASPNTGPTTDALPGSNRGKYLYMESDFGCTDGREAVLLSPEFDFQNINYPVLSFAYHAFGLGEGAIHLDMFVNGAWQHDIIEPIQGSEDRWQERHVPLMNAANMPSVRLRWRGVTGPVETCDFALDAIHIREAEQIDVAPIPVNSKALTCVRSNDTLSFLVQNLGLQAVNAMETQILWDNQNWGATQQILTTINPGQTVVLQVPTPALQKGKHTVSIITRAGSGHDHIPQNDTVTISVFVGAVIIGIPYLATFEVGAMDWYAEGTRNNWEHGAPRGTLLNRTPDGNFCWGTDLDGQYDNYEYSFLYSPCFDMTEAAGDPVLSFDYMTKTEYGRDKFWVEYSLDGGTWLKLGTHQSGITGWYNHVNHFWTGTTHGWLSAAHKLTGFSGHQVTFRMVLLTDGSRPNEGVLMDRFMIRYEYDLAITSITPEDVCDFSFGKKEVVTANIQNQGYYEVNRFDIQYKVDNSAFYPTQQFQGSILSGEVYPFIFTQTANLSSPGAHWIEAKLDLTNDVVPDNNLLRQRAGNYTAPVIDLGNDTMICSGQRLILNTGVQYGKYLWNTGHIYDKLYVFRGGIYEVNVVDSVGCEGYGKIEVRMPPAVTLQGQELLPVRCYGDLGMLEVSASGGVAPLQYTWSSGDITRITSMIPGGTYAVTVTDGMGCEFVKQIELKEPDSIHISLHTLKPVSCPRDSNGQIEMIVEGGTQPYTYRWSNGLTSQNIYTLKPGSYQLAVTDSNQCVKSYGAITMPVSADTVPRAAFKYQVSGGTVFFNSISQNATAYVWHYGDGVKRDGDITMEYTYQQNGRYPVTLIARNACGADTIVRYVNVVAVGIDDPHAFINLRLYPQPIQHGRFLIKNEGKNWQQAHMQLFDLHGRRLRSWQIGNLGINDEREFSLDQIPEGMYMIRLTAEGHSKTWKVTVL